MSLLLVAEKRWIGEVLKVVLEGKSGFLEEAGCPLSQLLLVDSDADSFVSAEGFACSENCYLNLLDLNLAVLS